MILCSWRSRALSLYQVIWGAIINRCSSCWPAPRPEMPKCCPWIEDFASSLFRVYRSRSPAAYWWFSSTCWRFLSRFSTSLALVCLCSNSSAQLSSGCQAGLCFLLCTPSSPAKCGCPFQYLPNALPRAIFRDLFFFVIK